MTLAVHSIEPRPDAPWLRFWGVRGSYPVSGAAFARYGGATPCIEVGLGASRFIVDAGTGLIALGASPAFRDVTEAHLLLTHLHHDHVQGLPFFKPLYRRDLTLHVWCGHLGGETAEAALDQMFAPPLFPFRLGQAGARLVFHGFRAGETITVDGCAVRTVALQHPSGATGYRFDGADGSAAIITDIEHAGGGDGATDACPAVAALCDGVDTLVYDTMLMASEYGGCRGWGHSTVEAALALKQRAGARRLVGFHHAPQHDDAIMAAREAALAAIAPGSLMAREGLVLRCAPMDALTENAPAHPAAFQPGLTPDTSALLT
jgi:phosphoribosyl 1,2-cyclic phosphodiesterase